MDFFSRLSLKYKLLSGFLPILLFVIGFTFYISYLNRSIADSFKKNSETFLELRVISRLDVLNTKLAEVTKAFTLTSDLKWQQEYDQISIEFDKLLVNSLSSLSSVDTRVLEDFRILTNRIKGTELLILSKTRDNDREGAIKLFDNVYISEQQTASNVLSEYIESKSDSVSLGISDTLDEINNSVTILSFFLIAFIIFIVLLFLYIFSRFVLHPVHNLVETAKLIQSGDLNAKSEGFYSDEIGDLAEAFNSMTSDLSRQIKKTSALLAQEEKDKELLEAKESALMSANMMLTELDEKKSEFISIVAHQLRTPLSGVKWTLSNFLDGEMGSLTLEQIEYLKKTYDSNQRVINLVEDMLSADRIESGKNPLILGEVDIKKIIDSVISDFDQKIKQKNIIMDIHKDDIVPILSCDNDKIRAVIQNFIENAIRYTKQDGKVSVSLVFNRNEHKVIFSVKDSGIGIPSDQIKYLFTKFFRAKNAMRMVTDGTGLGLFISKKIIDLHHGDMWCESKENEGSTFYFSLKV